MYLKVKDKVYFLLEPTNSGTRLSKMINGFIITLIVLNTMAVILETVPEIYHPHKELFKIVEVFSVIVFSIEYILRAWSCTSNKRYKHPITGRIKYITSLSAIIDLLAILPFYLPLFINYDLRFIRILRLIRLFRFFKLGRYLRASRVIIHVFKSKKEELVLSLIVILFLVVVASGIMYDTEHDAQPEKFSSIPETMLWSVATLTTVGYGGVYPITPLGKFLTACISILGIGLFALPAGILASGFSDEFKKMRKETSYCPHCGKELPQH